MKRRKKPKKLLKLVYSLGQLASITDPSAIAFWVITRRSSPHRK